MMGGKPQRVNVPLWPAGLLLLTLLTGCAAGGRATHTPESLSTTPVSTTTPDPSFGPLGSHLLRLAFPSTQTLPSIAGLKAGMRYLGWSYAGADDSRALVHIVVIAGGCTLVRALHTVETSTTVDIGVVGPQVPTGALCTADAVYVVLSVQLHHALGGRQLNALQSPG